MTMVEMESTALMTREAEVSPTPAEAPEQNAPRRSRMPGAVVVDRAVEVNRRYSPTYLRLALAVVFVWFGALKFTGASPVHDLIAATLPWFNADITVPVLGGIEIAIGLAVALGRLPRVTLLVLAGHLVGTFLTFVTAPHMMWSGNPLMLSSDGEFVVKNLVLIGAALVLIAHYSPRPKHRVAI
jgi:putative oxidoreductase